MLIFICCVLWSYFSRQSAFLWVLIVRPFLLTCFGIRIRLTPFKVLIEDQEKKITQTFIFTFRSYTIFELFYDLIWCFFLFNATFSNISAISWRPVLMVKEDGIIESTTGDRSKIRRRPHHNHQWNNTQCERNTKSRTLQIVIIFKIRLSYHNNNSKENVCF
jgi:hypothetical protein